MVKKLFALDISENISLRPSENNFNRLLIFHCFCCGTVVIIYSASEEFQDRAGERFLSPLQTLPTAGI